MSESQDTILIGVDGGGTGCRAAISRRDLKIIAQAEGGPANATTDFDLALANVRATIAAVAAKAGLGADDLSHAHAHIGLAGVINQAVAARLKAAFDFATCGVTDDRPTTVCGALGACGSLGSGDGFVVAVGTGTIAAARRGGQIRYVGGWGFYVADQGSGAWLGRNLLERTLLCFDGVLPHSGLTRATLRRFHDDPNQIVGFSRTAKPGDYAAFARDVISAAADGDAIATGLMAAGAAHLSAALKTLGMAPGDRLCLSGGLGRYYRAYLPAGQTGNLTPPQGSALDGALCLARLKATQAMGAAP